MVRVLRGGLLLFAVAAYLVEIVRICGEGEFVEEIAQGGRGLVGARRREAVLWVGVHGISAMASCSSSSGR